MAGIHGSKIVLKIGDGADPEVFAAVAGLRSKKMSINNEGIDATNQDSPDLWRQYLDQGGIKNMGLSADGVFVDAAGQATLIGIVMSGSNITNSCQLVWPGLGTFAGSYLFEGLEYNADNTDAAQFSLTLNSNGPITFTAE